jgi:hypothetical protein
MIEISIFNAIDIAFLLAGFSFINGWLMAEAHAAKAAAKAAAKKVWYSPATIETLRQNLTTTCHVNSKTGLVTNPEIQMFTYPSLLDTKN